MKNAVKDRCVCSSSGGGGILLPVESFAVGTEPLATTKPYVPKSRGQGMPYPFLQMMPSYTCQIMSESITGLLPVFEKCKTISGYKIN